MPLTMTTDSTNMPSATRLLHPVRKPARVVRKSDRPPLAHTVKPVSAYLKLRKKHKNSADIKSVEFFFIILHGLMNYINIQAIFIITN